MKILLFCIAPLITFSSFSAFAASYFSSEKQQYVSCREGCEHCYESSFLSNNGITTSYYIQCDLCSTGYELQTDYIAAGTYHGRLSWTSCEPVKTVCPANCSACSSSSVCTACGNGYTLSGGQCIEKIQSVESCPQDMKLSSDGCCCLNN